MNPAKFVVPALMVLTFAGSVQAQTPDAAAVADAPSEPLTPTTPDAAPVNSPVAQESAPVPVALEPASVAAVPPSHDAAHGLRRRGVAALAEFEMFAHGLELRAGDARRSEAALSRAEVGLQVGFASNADRAGGHATAQAFGELRLEAIRSITPQSGFGVDGDSLVLRVKRARVSGQWKVARASLHGEVGLVADPWLQGLDADPGLRPLVASVSESDLYQWSSDLGAVVSGQLGPVRATLAVVNGEGRNFAERNTGKNTIGMLDATVPLGHIAQQPARLWLAAMGRDGSYGPGSARDHRFGAASMLVTDVGAAGVEVVRGLGVAGRGDVTAWASAAWLHVPVPVFPRWSFAGRFARSNFAIDNDPSTGRKQSVLGAVSLVVLPGWKATDVAGLRSTLTPASALCGGHGVRAWLSVDRRTVSGIATSLAGTSAQDATAIMRTMSACGLV
ncbi:MAG: hypothetical protein KBG15_21955, partial [Kofleriaceae bacterium]|nr:hypothetical protein [Kofleriaceae bacterium]